MEKIDTVCVIGGAGFVGRHIVRLLQDLPVIRCACRRAATRAPRI